MTLNSWIASTLGRKRHVIVDELVVVDAIQQVVIGLLAVAVDIGAAGVEGGRPVLKAPGLVVTAPGVSSVS